MKYKIGISLIIISSIFVCFGQLFWKFYGLEGELHFLLLGFILYACGAFLMIFSYKFGPLSKLQPLISISYVFAILLSSIFLDETITIYTIFGIFLIFVGVILIGGADE